MSVIKAKIKVDQIDKSLLFKGEKYTFMDIDIAQLKEPDQYGNTHSVYQYNKDTKQKHYIGNAKTWSFDQPEQPATVKESLTAHNDLPF